LFLDFVELNLHVLQVFIVLFARNQFIAQEMTLEMTFLFAMAEMHQHKKIPIQLNCEHAFKVRARWTSFWTSGYLLNCEPTGLQFANMKCVPVVFYSCHH
jgi:hypothetical protein